MANISRYDLVNYHVTHFYTGKEYCNGNDFILICYEIDDIRDATINHDPWLIEVQITEMMNTADHFSLLIDAWPQYI
ncbi:hypothetical protein RLOatenuis_2430 [Rickettsiales bacterium]|nr:hypothetical protein RLOatenuis_2430 [Rickettsiales bacterium]